jgi:Predicted transcriptional regulators
LFTLDYKSRLPIYEQLYQSVTQMSAVGAFDPGEPLPSVRALAQELGVNPNTVQKAYQMLERDGIIYTVPGKGSFVSKSDSAVNRQREMVFQKLGETVKSAAGCGIEETELIAQIHQYYLAEGAKHHD